MTVSQGQEPLKSPENSPESAPKTALPDLQDSFIRSVGRSVRSTKLGDMLVNSRMITRVQLKDALRKQKETGKRLGHVLLEAGYVTPTALYRKLAQQWVLKVSTAGIALMMQFFTPSIARADDGGAVRLAAATSSASVIKPGISASNLFGSTEVKSTNISAFTKWTTVMKRFDQQMASQASSPVVKDWKAHLGTLKGKSVRDQINGVNSYMNSIRYVEDSQGYKKSDYWATPIEFLGKGSGDCEDYAIAKYASLRALGFSSDQMRIAIVQDKIKNVPHAILIVYTQDGVFVLDNQNKQVADASQVNRYKPIFSINSNNWWLHKSPGGLT
ncbi:MAG: transglutaminase-like cysteine peptidase [Alphaproteobacteria bacterium]